MPYSSCRKLAIFVVTAPVVSATNTGSCDVPGNARKDCGHPGTNQQMCESSGCCWVPAVSNSSNGAGIPWCFYKSGPSPGPSPPPGPGPSPPGGSCDIASSEKQDCGIGNQGQCEQSGCCWHPMMTSNVTGGGIPWCYHKSSHPSGSCAKTNWKADAPGFTDDFADTMRNLFEQNLDMDGSGAVVASRDRHTAAGSYYYHWMRDGALSMKTYMDIHDANYDVVAAKMRSYVKWVQKLQNEADPNHIDVRIDPKYNIPSGVPYTQGWCRPQTDGPGLRATTLTIWGNILGKQGLSNEAKNVVFPLIEKDLDWVVHNWQSKGCDLWEDNQSPDFFWGKMAFVYALHTAADLALNVGKHTLVAQYHSTADTIKASLQEHWNGNYLYESSNRPQDGAVIHAIATFGNAQTTFPVTSFQSAKTIENLRALFCNKFPINQNDEPGVLIGRYPADVYAGGNPWQLLSAVLAETFYIASKEFSAHFNGASTVQILADDITAWTDLMNVASASDLPKATFQAGDAVLSRIWKHVKNDGGYIYEQIDKNTGAQKNARGLTWSYANILHALHVRKGLGKASEFVMML